MNCDWDIADGWARCKRVGCGQKVRTTKTDPDKIRGECRSPDVPARFAGERLPIPDCVHRGAATGDVRTCKVCGQDRGQVWPVFACAVRGACTHRAWRVGQKEGACDTCVDVSFPPVVAKPPATVADAVTVGITAFQRPASLERLIASIRRHYPTVRIIVADNGDLPASVPLDVEYLSLPFDVGLSAARNALADAVQTPYLLLCEDDFEFTPATRLERFLDVLEHDGELACVGGPLLNGDAREDYATDLRLFRGALEITATSQPWRATPSGTAYRLCDQTFNWGLWRRDVLVEAHCWDDRLKLHEHFDWFWSVKQAGQWRVAWCDVPARHMRTAPGDYGQFRARAKDFAGLHAEKWGIERVTYHRPPQAALVRPNVVLLGVGNCGSTVAARCLEALGWSLGGDADEFAEPTEIRALNDMAKAGGLDQQVAALALSRLPQPWSIKDPRFCATLDQWLGVLTPYQPLLLWLCRDLGAVAKSWERRGWSSANVAKRHEAAARQFELWPWARVKIDFEGLLAAGDLIDRGQVRAD